MERTSRKRRSRAGDLLVSGAIGYIVVGLVAVLGELSWTAAASDHSVRGRNWIFIDWSLIGRDARTSN